MSPEEAVQKIDISEITQKIGYGHGITTGYTTDGAIWLCADSRDKDGQPTMSVFTWSIEQALALSENIASAAKKARNALQHNIEVNADVRPDGNGINKIGTP